MENQYSGVRSEDLERWYKITCENVLYWGDRLRMWQAEIVKQVEASKYTNKWIDPLIEYTISDEALAPLFVGYRDACELLYRYSYQASKMYEEICLRRVADFSGEGNFKVEVVLRAGQEESARISNSQRR